MLKGDGKEIDRPSQESEMASSNHFTVLHCEPSVEGAKEALSTALSSGMIMFEEIDGEVLDLASLSEMIEFEGIEGEVLIPESSSEMIEFEGLEAEVLIPASLSEMITSKGLEAEVSSPASEMIPLEEIKIEVLDSVSPSETSMFEEIKEEVLNPAPPSETSMFEEIKEEVLCPESLSEMNMFEEIKEEVLSPASPMETSGLFSTLIANESNFEEPVNVASPSNDTSDDQLDSLPLSRRKPASKNTLNQNSMSMPKTQTRRYRQPECTCPYCSAEGGNTTKGPNGKPQHICHFPDCRKIFGYARSLYRHLRLHDGRKNHLCPLCSKEFARKDSLKAHVATHITGKGREGRWVKCLCANCSVEGSKKTECLEKKWKHACNYPNCGKAYTQIGNLKRHLLTHDGEKIFFCEHCDEGYARKDELRWHMNLHLNEGRKWARCRCPNCRIPGGVRDPEGKLLHVCHIPGCGKVYTNSTVLKTHLASHAREKYNCQNCDRKFLRQDSYNRHIKSCNEMIRQEKQR